MSSQGVEPQPGQRPPATPAEIGASVVEEIRRAIQAKAEKEGVSAVHVVICNTSLPYDQGGMYNGRVYHRENATIPEKKAVHAWANGKARFCNRTHRDSKDAWRFPHILRGGDYYFGGGVWRDEITVAVSGFSEEVDHTFAEEIVKMVMRAYDRLLAWHKEYGASEGFMSNFVPTPPAPCGE